MAARRLLSSLPRPANSSLLRRRSPNITPVYRSLLDLSPNLKLRSHNPKPRIPNPDLVLGSRSSCTTTRPFSTKSESDHRPNRATEYRRRLGIDGARVTLRPPFSPWEPPKEGEVKINFHVREIFGDYDDRDGDGDRCVGVNAEAADSSGRTLVVSSGDVKHHGNELEQQLCALKGAANLAKELKSTGTHDGPVVYETLHVQVVRYFHGDPDLVPEDALGDCGFWRDLPGYADLDAVSLGIFYITLEPVDLFHFLSLRRYWISSSQQV